MMFMNLNAQSPDDFVQNIDSQQIQSILRVWAKRLVSNDNTISYEKQNYACDKKDKIQQAIQSGKKLFRNTFNNLVYTPLTFYEFHMLDHLYKLFKQFSFQKIAQAISYRSNIQNFLSILSFTKDVVDCETVASELKNYVIKQLTNLVKEVYNTKFAEKGRRPQTLYTQTQGNFFLMIVTFKALEKQYNPYVRRVIKRIFNQFASDDFMNTTETLRYLQNQRSEIQLMPQLTQQQLFSISNKLLLKTYDYYQKKNSKELIPKIQLKKISQNERRKVVNILVSGFLSQNMNKKAIWADLLNCMPDSQVYGLEWQSETIAKLVSFIASTGVQLAFTNTKLEDKFRDNPFNPAFELAQESGKYLAHLVHDLFQNQFINIIGYSLGVELVKQFVNTTMQLNKAKNLQKIVLLGGVSDCQDFHQVLRKISFPLSITNMYTSNDKVLDLLLKRCRPGIQPVGLKQMIKSQQHYIDNTDVSQDVKGHLFYMIKFKKIAGLLQLNEQ